MKAVLATVAVFALLACALAQNADDARALGAPGNSYCSALCTKAIELNSSYKNMMGFCKQQCDKCVSDVAATPQGKGAPLPESCKVAYKFKEIPQIIADFQAGKLTAQKGP